MQNIFGWDFLIFILTSPWSLESVRRKLCHTMNHCQPSFSLVQSHAFHICQTCWVTTQKNNHGRFWKNLIAKIAWKYFYLLICSEIVLNLFNDWTILLFCFGVAFNSYLKSRKQGILQNTSLDRSIDRDQSLRPKGCKPSIILHPWEFLCLRDAGCRGNKITDLGRLKKYNDKKAFYSLLVRTRLQVALLIKF